MNSSQLNYYLSVSPGIMVCPTSPCACVSVCGRPFSVFCWLPQTLALWCVTLHDSQRKPSLPSSASSLSTKLWRNLFIWERHTLLTCTTTSTSSLSTREYWHTHNILPQVHSYNSAVHVDKVINVKYYDIFVCVFQMCVYNAYKTQ